MKRLTKIVRIRLSEEDVSILKGKNISQYIRAALLEKLIQDYPKKLPF